VAIAQQFSRSFARTMHIAMVVGAVLCVAGLTITYYQDLQPGALIVVLGVVAYAIAAGIRAVAQARSSRGTETA
jgi:zinc transport system permease protein